MACKCEGPNLIKIIFKKNKCVGLQPPELNFLQSCQRLKENEKYTSIDFKKFLNSQERDSDITITSFTKKEQLQFSGGKDGLLSISSAGAKWMVLEKWVFPPICNVHKSSLMVVYTPIYEKLKHSIIWNKTIKKFFINFKKADVS